MKIFWRRCISHKACMCVRERHPLSVNADSFQAVSTFKQAASRFHQEGDDADNNAEVVAAKIR